MRKFAGNYVSGRVKVKSPSEVTTDRYNYLGLDQAEPNLGGTPSDFRKTFTNSDVNTGQNQITVTGHGFVTGEKIVYDSSDAASSVGNLVSGNTYFIISISADVFSLADTKVLADSASPRNLSGTGGDGNHYVGKTTVLATSLGGDRLFVDIGDDLELEPDGSNYKIKISDGATQTIQSNTISQATLQQVTTQGSVSDVASSFTNTTDSTNFDTGALTIGGGLGVAKTLYMDDLQSIKFRGDGSSYTDTALKSIFSNNGVSSEFRISPGIKDVSASQTQYAAVDGSAGQMTAFRVSQNLNYSTGKQFSKIYLGKVANETITGTSQFSTPSESHVYANQTLVLDPFPVGNIGGTVKINGDLEVLGTQTTVNSTTLEVTDLNIVVAKDATTPGNTNGAGITFGTYPTTPSATTWVDPNDLQGQTANPVPSITWVNATGRITSSKSFEAPGFVSTAGAAGFLISDGTVDTTNYAAQDTQYTLDAQTNASNGFLSITDNSASPTTQRVKFTGTNGISVSSAVSTTGGQNPTDGTITIDGSSVPGTTYSLGSLANANNAFANLVLTPSAGTTHTVVVKGQNNIVVSDADSGGSITITDSNTPSYSAAGAKITVANTTTSSNPSGLVQSELALDVSGTTSGVVAKFKRSNEAASGHAFGGVILAEINDDGDAENNPWMSFTNVGSAVDNASNPIQGEITTKYTETSNKSGIRIWGQNNIDFDVDNGANTPANLSSRRISFTSDGLVLRNSSSIVHDGGSFNTTLTFTTPTADRTITFPDAGGELLTAGTISSLVGQIKTVNSTTNSDHFVVFAETAVSAAGTDQDPLTNTKLKFNPSTGALTLTGTLTATAKSFLIDHPTKDAMKLQYASLEGPENGVYVRGRLKDSNVIELPDYWTGLVDETTITVNLTPVGSHQNLFVQDINDNQIIVGCDEPVNCFYTIFGERKDIEQLVVEYEDQ